MNRARQGLRWVLAAGFVLAAVIMLILAIPSGFLTLPLGLLFGGLSLAVFQGDYDQKPEGLARWLIRIGLGLFLLEVVVTFIVGVTNWL